VGSIVGLAEAEVGDDGVEVRVHRKRAEVAERGDLAAHVVGRGREHEAQERESPRAREPPDDAEVEECGASVPHHEEVAAVQVAVEHAVHQRALHEGHHAGAHDGDRVDARLAHARRVVELEALESLHHEHAARDELGVRARHHVSVLAELAQDARDLDHVVGLHAEVELLDDRLGEELDERGGIGERRDLDAPDQVRREPGHDAQVAAHELADRRSLDLDHDLLAGGEARRVDLCDGGRGEGRRRDPVEGLLERAGEVLLEHAADGREVLGGDLVAATLELGHELDGEEPLAARDDLRELDVRRPESLDREAHAQREVGDRRRAGGVAAAARAPHPRHERPGERPDHDE